MIDCRLSTFISFIRFTKASPELRTLGILKLSLFKPNPVCHLMTTSKQTFSRDHVSAAMSDLRVQTPKSPP